MTRYTTLTFAALILLMGFVQAIRRSLAEDPDAFQPEVLGMKIPVATSKADLEQHVGRLVAVRGTADNSKIPRLAGAEVRMEDKCERSTNRILSRVLK